MSREYGHAAFLAAKPEWLDGAWAEARADHPEATEASS